MIKKLRMKNFKCFSNQNLNFKTLNVICGPNSSGKSSINQAILLFLQNNGLKAKDFLSNGKYVHFDEYEEIKNSSISAEKNVEIAIYNEKNKKNVIELQVSDDGKINCKDLEFNFSISEEDDIYYLSANRIGPEDVYSKFSGNFINFDGENAIGFLAKNQDAIINEKFVYEKQPGKDYKFSKEIKYWLQEIIDEEINVKEILRTDRSTATYTHKNNTLEVRNKNTGNGLSYIISILVMVFSVSLKGDDKKPLFIIENPEIHLHPLAQTKLMSFISFMSEFCQFIIESHSEYIVNSALQKKGAQVIKLNKDFCPVYYDKKSKYTLQTLTSGEVQWAAFDIPTIDFHMSLFAYLELKFNKTLNHLDDEIRETTSFKKDKKKFDTKSKRHNNFKGAKSEYETICLYLRNLIDHPIKNKEKYPTRKKFRKIENFQKALKTSISLMIDIIKEKGW